MKHSSFISLIASVILLVILTCPLVAQGIYGDSPFYLAQQAKKEADRRAPMIAQHGHWHDDFFEMRVGTPIKNSILDKFAHFGDNFKPLPTDDEIYDGVFDESDQLSLRRENELRVFLYNCATTWNGSWDGNCTWYYTHRLPKNKEEEARYKEKYVLEKSGNQIKNRDKKVAKLVKAYEAKEKEEKSRIQKHDQAIADYKRYLVKNPDIQLAIDREKEEYDRKEKEDREKRWQKLMSDVDKDWKEWKDEKKK